MPRRKTTAEFIADARAVHGDRYDYSQVEYLNCTNKVTIGCPEHGVFSKRPEDHLLGQECPACTKIRKTLKASKTIEEFVSDAHKVHGNIFDYSLAKYINNNTKVEIVCPKHGHFWQSPGNHLSGKQCPKCALLKRANKRTKTTEKFIEEAREVHKDFYDYSKVNYKGQNSEVKIVCKKHGEFYQKPHIHLMGSGCHKCGIEKLISKKTKSTTGFIEDAKEIHGDRYDYSKVEYRGTDTNVIIVCQTHGEFLQTPSTHRRGGGCQACSGVKRYDKESFVERAKIAHGEKYDYAKVNIVNARTKVTIGCPLHGYFIQEPHHHVSGVGCPECKKVSISEAQSKSQDEFIADSRKLHGGTYDYSKVVYAGSKADVTIICPTHGEFKQQARAHLQEYGCPKCADIRSADAKRKTTEQFIAEAISIHGNKYDYSLAKYKGAFDSVKIICPDHGVFEQAAGRHSGGTGCSACADWGFDPSKPTILYYLKITANDKTYYKVGITNRTAEARTGGNVDFEVLEAWQFKTGVDALKIEQFILNHPELSQYRTKDRNFLPKSGETECFEVDILDMNDGWARAFLDEYAEHS